MSLNDILEAQERIAFSVPAHSYRGQIPALIISDINNSASTAAARVVMQSIRDTDSQLLPYIVPATTPETLDNDLKLFGLKKSDWTYPSAGEKRIDIKTGLHLSGYNAKNMDKVISCMVSHMKCWLSASAHIFPIVVLEHDAIFKRKFDAFKGMTGTESNKYEILSSKGIIGLNNPRGATRKSATYFDKVIESSNDGKEYFSGHKIVDVPWVDDDRYSPQGLAGNSAYYIAPNMAKNLLRKVLEVGLWPNDALMCKQFFPNQLKQMYPFMTELQGVGSTTQG